MDATNLQSFRTRFRYWWLLLGALLIFVYLIRDVLPPFAIGAGIAYLVSPAVEGIERRWKLPHLLVVLTIYLIFLVAFGTLLFFAGPRLFTEIRELYFRAPQILTSFLEQLFGPGPYSLIGPPVTAAQFARDMIDSWRGSIGTPTTALLVVGRVSGFLLDLFLTLIVSLYLLIDSERVSLTIVRLAPVGDRPRVRVASDEIHRTLARYFRGELFLVVLVSVVSFIGLEFAFHLRYAITLALLTGIVEIIPFIGPVIAAAVVSVVALTQGGPQLAVEVLIFYLIIRQLEDQLIMPFVVGRAVELHPVIVIFSVLAGGALFGILGSLLAVPIAASLKISLGYWPELVPPARSPSTVPTRAAD